MAYGLRSLRKIQFGKETTPGTAVAAVEPIYGVMDVVTSDEVWHKPEQDRGVLSMNYETPFKVGKEVELTFEGEWYDRLAVWVMSNAVRGNVTPTQPDNINEPNTYLWTFEPALTAPNTPDQTNGIDTYTVELGDNVQAYEYEYVFVKSIEISGAPNEPINVSVTFGGRQASDVTFTAALTAQTAAYFPFNLAEFYIDSSYAGIGGTQKTGMLRAFTWTFETQFTPLYAADGSFVFSGINEAPKTVQLELTYYRDGTNSEAEFDAYEAQTMRYFRIACRGETEMDSGQNNPPYVYLDGAFRYTEFPALEDEDGTAVVTVTAEAFYDVTASKMFSVLVGTTMSAFPS